MGRKINALKLSNYPGKLILVFKFPVKPEKKNKLLEMFAPHVEISRKEPGCQHYSLHADFLDENIIWLKEEWENLEALKLGSI